MNPNFPDLPTVLFMATTAICALMLLVGIRYSLFRADSINQSGATQAAAFLTAAWLISLAFLARQGFFFKGLDSFPPRIMLALLPITGLIIGLLFVRRVGELLDAIPATWLIVPQVFRVAVEIVLWQLHEGTYAPEQMTFEGLNFDILAGATAPIIAFICFGQGRNLRWLAIIWNILGLGLLLNIITIAILSIPAIGYFDQPNIFIAWFPYIWLPGFVAPFALFLHAMSLRQLFRRGGQ